VKVSYNVVSMKVCLAVLFRIAFVGAREGHFPVAVSLINYKRFTPVLALIVNVCSVLH